jgi:hypothetical protein
MDDDVGAPASYLTLEEGTPVLASDEQPIGTVRHVLAAPEQDIFEGLVVEIDGAGTRFADAEHVASIHEHGVLLTIGAEAARRLPEPSANPAAMSVGPDDVVRPELHDRLRRAWQWLSGQG